VKIGQSVQQEKSFTINSAEIGVVLMRQRRIPFESRDAWFRLVRLRPSFWRIRSCRYV